MVFLPFQKSSQQPILMIFVEIGVIYLLYQELTNPIHNIILMKPILIGLITIHLLLAAVAEVASPCQHIDGCEVCTVGGLCAMCQENYMLSINKSLMKTQCVPMDCELAGCSRCLTQEVCVACLHDYELGFNGKCYLVGQDDQYSEMFGFDGCQDRLPSGKCTSCLIGFILTDGECLMGKSLIEATTVTCNLVNCDTCLTPNFCKTCATNFQVSSSGTCVDPATIENCQLYGPTTSSCTVCQSGYVFSTNPGSGTSNICVLCQVAGCESCSSQNTCSACYTGYTLNQTSNTCILSNCRPPCATCSTSGTCTTCISPFNSQALDNGTCFTCSVANCQSCSIQSTGVCTTCYDPYVADSTGACVLPCDSVLCTACTTTSGSTSNGVCTACVSGYTLVSSTGSTKNCVKCSGAPTCKTCNSDQSTCTSCISGYYIEDGICEKCITGCSSCDGPLMSDCSVLVGGFTITVEDGDKATQPSICDYGCGTCSSIYPQACINCMYGFYWEDWVCIPCDTSCKTCVPGSPNSCLSCYANAHFNSSNNVCIRCSQENNCLTCDKDTPNTCTSCPYGFYLSDGHCSNRCLQDCLTCYVAQSTSSLYGLNEDNLVCTLCETGYSLSWYGACLPCMSNCRVCSGQAQNICLSCGVGYYLTGINSCQACPDGCTSCTSLGCYACTTGYYLDDSNTCVLNCEFPCATCSSTSTTSCTSCYYGYSLTTGTANTIPTCLPETCNSTGGCYACAFGQYLSSGECVSCGGDCARCTVVNNQTQCTSCYEGFFLQVVQSTDSETRSCQSCPDNCTICNSAESCQVCATGYVTFTQPVLGTRQYCIPCSPPCQTCTINPETCSSCVSGFTFTGWSCVSDFYYNFVMAFDVSPQTFFLNYQSFLNFTIESMQTENYKVISMQSVTTSATSVSQTQATAKISTIQSSTSYEASLEFQNLEFKLLGKGFFANMPVINQTLTSSEELGDFSNPASFYTALFIPLGILLVGGVLYFVMSRRNLDLPGSNYQRANQDSARSQGNYEMREL